MKLETWLRMAKLPYQTVIVTWRGYREVLATLLPTEVSKTEWESFVEGIRENVRAQMYGHGMARHSNEEIIQIICADFQALSDVLNKGIKKFDKNCAIAHHRRLG